jgi:hypothetical protein
MYYYGNVRKRNNRPDQMIAELDCSPYILNRTLVT